MAKTITLKYEAVCRDCGAYLPAGSRAKYYNHRHIYGLDCHARSQKPRRNWRRDDPFRLKPFLSDSHAVRKEPMILREGMEVPLWDKR